MDPQAFKASNKRAHTALQEVVRHTERLDHSGRLATEVGEVTRWIREVDTTLTLTLTQP